MACGPREAAARRGAAGLRIESRLPTGRRKSLPGGARVAERKKERGAGLGWKEKLGRLPGKLGRGKKERRKRGKEGREVGLGQNRKGEKERFSQF